MIIQVGPDSILLCSVIYKFVTTNTFNCYGTIGFMCSVKGPNSFHLITISKNAAVVITEKKLFFIAFSFSIYMFVDERYNSVGMIQNSDKKGYYQVLFIKAIILNRN